MALQNALPAWPQGADPTSVAGTAAALDGSSLTSPLPRTFPLQDRQVYLTSEDVNIYCLCRKWIQNLPEEEAPVPEAATFSLPAPAPTRNDLVGDEHPAPPTYSDPFTQQKYEPEEALRLMKAHWIAVRQHFQAGVRERAQKQQQRLLPWLSAATLPLAGTAGMATHPAVGTDMAGGVL